MGVKGGGRYNVLGMGEVQGVGDGGGKRCWGGRRQWVLKVGGTRC